MAKAIQKTKHGRNTGQQVSRPLDSERTSTQPVFLPLTDVYETPETIVVTAEMPGIGPEGVDITLEGRELTIRGKASDQAHEGYRQVYTEYALGDYERVFTLSEDIERDHIEASYKNGVLHLVLPKAEQAKARKIKLKAA